MFALRGGLFVLHTLSGEIAHTLKFIAEASKGLIDTITPPIANIDIDAFSPPVEQRTVAVPRAPEVHFQTFVEVLVAVIQQGQSESEGGVTQGRRDSLISGRKCRRHSGCSLHENILQHVPAEAAEGA